MAPALGFAYTRLPARIRNTVLLPNLRRLVKSSDLPLVLGYTRKMHAGAACLDATPKDNRAAARAMASSNSPPHYRKALASEVLSRSASRTRRAPLMSPWTMPLRDLSTPGSVMTATLNWAFTSMSLDNDTTPDAYVDRLQFMPADNTMIPRWSSFWCFVGTGDSSIEGPNWPKDSLAAMKQRILSNSPRINTDDISTFFETQEQFQAAVNHLMYEKYRQFN